MFADIIEEIGESVTVVRLSAGKDEESIIANEIMCVIDHENQKAELDANREIRKGDILRRDDGSELQVLRTATQRDSIGGDITQLDLRDYDHQELPLQENEVDMPEPDLPKLELHPVITQKVLPIFEKGIYDSAVFQAFKQVEIAVRDAGGYEENDRGTDLMRTAFNVGTGNLTDKSRLLAVKQAMSDFFAGAIGLYKNPSSHHEVEFAPEEAAEVIIIASHLLRLVDSCAERTSNPPN